MTITTATYKLKRRKEGEEESHVLGPMVRSRLDRDDKGACAA